MPYTAPSTITSGQLVTTTIMNNEWAGNISFLANPPACRVYHNATQAIATATPTILAFNTERFDTNSMHDTATLNSRITINTAGLYYVWGEIEWAANATGVREIALRVNGSTFPAVPVQSAASAGSTVQQVSTLWKFAAGDYVELRGQQTSGGSLNVSAGSAANAYQCEFAAVWVGLG